jgi:hypothetical protein
MTLLGNQNIAKEGKVVLKACTGSKEKIDDEGNK